MEFVKELLERKAIELGYLIKYNTKDDLIYNELLKNRQEIRDALLLLMRVIR